MLVFKLIDHNARAIKLTENNYNIATRKKYPYYQSYNNEKRHYALCPECDNPIVIIHLHVDEQFYDSSKRKVKMHGRHVKRSIPDLATYDQSAYDSCPFANPASGISKERRNPSKVTQKLLDLVRNFPDVIDNVMRRDVGIGVSELQFESMLRMFKEERGHLYRHVNRFNLPYSFMYLAESQNLILATVDTNYEAGRELSKEINDNSKWCHVRQYGSVRKNNGLEGFVELVFYFVKFGNIVIDEEKYPKFTLFVDEKYQGEKRNVLKKDILFDQFYYTNVVSKRMRYKDLANKELGSC